MAKKPNNASSESADDLIGTDQVQAFVLRDCTFGHAGEVVELSADDAKAGAEQGALDLHPNAIAAAKENQ